MTTLNQHQHRFCSTLGPTTHTTIEQQQQQEVGNKNRINFKPPLTVSSSMSMHLWPHLHPANKLLSIHVYLLLLFLSIYPEPTVLGQQRQLRRTQPLLDIQQLAISRGFSIESHKIITKDQYILVAHRLINPLLARQGGVAKTRGVVILQHGILCASPLFLMNSSPHDRPTNSGSHYYSNETQNSLANSNSLAIALSNHGYDVWLTNFRGTQYSHGHLKEHGLDYWNFNVDTLIEYDYSAYVNYILRLTKRKKYTFIAHSLGATVGIGSLLIHQNTPIISKLSCSILMAPVVSTQFMRGSLIPLFKLATIFYGDPAPFPGPTATLSTFVRQICMFTPTVCTWMANMFIGAKQAGVWSAATSPSWSSLSSSSFLMPNFRPTNPWQTAYLPASLQSVAQKSTQPQATTNFEELSEFQNQENAFTLMMHQSISIQLLKHIVQVHSSGRLTRFSYGAEGNQKRYGKKVAPTYDLAQINEPNLAMAIVSGPSDAISTPDEINWISKQIQGKVGRLEQITVPVNPFNHMDLVMSRDADRLVNRRVLEFIERNRC